MTHRRMPRKLVAAFQEARFGIGVFQRMHDQFAITTVSPGERALQQLWIASLSDTMRRGRALIRETRAQWFAGALSDEDAVVVLRQVPVLFQVLLAAWWPRVTDDA